MSPSVGILFCNEVTNWSPKSAAHFHNDTEWQGQEGWRKTGGKQEENRRKTGGKQEENRRKTRGNMEGKKEVNKKTGKQEVEENRGIFLFPRGS